VCGGRGSLQRRTPPASGGTGMASRQQSITVQAWYLCSALATKCCPLLNMSRSYLGIERTLRHQVRAHLRDARMHGSRLQHREHVVTESN
jgi:hypothetical protein